MDRVGYFDEGIPAIEDYDYWLRVAQHYHVDFVPDPLVRYYDPEPVPSGSRSTRRRTTTPATGSTTST